MVIRARQIGMRKRNPAERGVAERIARCRLPIGSEEEARLGIDEGVAPAIEYDASDIAFGLEAGVLISSSTTKVEGFKKMNRRSQPEFRPDR